MRLPIHHEPDLSANVRSGSGENARAFRAGSSDADTWPSLQPSKAGEDLDAALVASAPVRPAPPDIVAALSRFSEISLEETDKSASMLKRIDNKYVVDRSTLLALLDDLREEFRVLRINGKGVFSYKSCYFDDDSRCFKEHQQGRRQRFKVRTRLYVESDRAYFEIKLKGKRGRTEKSREKCDNFHAYAINDQQMQMMRDLYEQNYGRTFLYSMSPALHVSYSRFTLVSAHGGERITVDMSLGFESPSGRKVLIGNDFVIVETKSGDGRGKSDWVMKRRRIRTARGCSKYCIGTVLVGEAEKHSKFRPIVKTVRSRMQGNDAADPRKELTDSLMPGGHSNTWG